MRVTPTPQSKRIYNFDERENNHFELLVDGEQFFPRMLQSIKEANHYILFEQYLVESSQIASRFIDELIKATKRNVTVYMLLDDFGSQALSVKDRESLYNHGIKLQFYNPIRIKSLYRSLFRNHRKMLLVDNEIAYVGGAGITDEFDTANNKHAWHEVMVGISGPVVSDWSALFIHTWSVSEKEKISLPKITVATQQDHAKGQVVCSTGLGKQEITRVLIRKIRRTEKRVWLATPYFVTTWAVRRSLRYAARKGVDVRVLVPGPYSDHPWVGHASRYLYPRLIRAGVRIFEYQPRFTHSKIQLCDDWVSIGSSNLDRWNHRWNLDANQVIHSNKMANQVQSLFEKDFKQSVEINLQHWQRRSLLQRFREWLSHMLVRIIERVAK